MAKFVPFKKESPKKETMKFEKAERKSLGPKKFAAEEKSEGDVRFKKKPQKL